MHTYIHVHASSSDLFYAARSRKAPANCSLRCAEEIYCDWVAGQFCLTGALQQQFHFSVASVVEIDTEYSPFEDVFICNRNRNLRTSSRNLRTSRAPLKR